MIAHPPDPWCRLRWPLALAFGVAQAQLQLCTLDLSGNGVMQYALSLSQDFEPERSYPLLLAQTPGP